MPVTYVDLDTAKSADGLRMVVVGGVPSAWGEAAKGIFHIKGIDWLAVRLDQSDNDMAAWTGRRDGPVAMYKDERPRAGWPEILFLAERLAPEPALMPADPAKRALMFGLSHEIFGEGGIAWTRRLEGVHAGLQDAGGFPAPVAAYLAAKYGYTPELGETTRARLHSLFDLFTAQLAGQDYLIDNTFTAADIYLATCMAFFSPLPNELCEMNPAIRAAFETTDSDTIEKAAALFAHRDRMYERHLETPLSL
ncbi:MAG: glutathione binding-like protein [Pseudomonadota bacterium]